MKTIDNFNDLPEDCILDVFDYLDAKILKNAIEVCKQWNEIIGLSSSTMSKFTFMFPRQWKGEIHHIKAMKKKIRTIEFFCIDIRDCEELFAAIDHLNSQIETLILKKVRIDSRSFAKLVKMFDLKKIIIIGSDINDNPDLTYDLAGENSGMKLDLLALQSPTVKMFKILLLLKIQSRKIVLDMAEYWLSNDPSDATRAAMRAAMKAWFEQQEILSEFIVRTPATNSDLDFISYELKTKKLHKLTVLVAKMFRSNDDNSLVKFLEFIQDHQTNLAELNIRCASMSERVLHAIKKCRNPKNIRVNVGELPQTIDMAGRMQPNVAVKTFKLYQCQSAQTVGEVFKIFPAIEVLEQFEYSSGYCEEFIIAAHERLSSLKRLNVPKIPVNASMLTFPNLHMLEVDDMDIAPGSVQAMQTFLSNNPSLRTLIVKWISHETNLVDLLSRQLINLRELFVNVRSGESLTITQETLRVLNANLPSLQRITIFDDAERERSSFEENVSHHSIEVFRFNRRDFNKIYFENFGDFKFKDNDPELKKLGYWHC